MDEYIKKLEKENRYLKSLLDRAGIPYDVDSEIEPMKSEAEGNTDQGARIMSRTIAGRDARGFEKARSNAGIVESRLI